MTTFFTSDTHFAHANIIAYCGRPFRDVEEMNAELVARWNARVGPEDTVYHLGDFAFGPVDNIDRFRTMLNGKIYLVRGNHDKSIPRMEQAFGVGKVQNEVALLYERKMLFLSHKPTTESGFLIDYHLHGHVHEKYARRGNQINVGVDVRGFAPATLEELLA